MLKPSEFGLSEEGGKAVGKQVRENMARLAAEDARGKIERYRKGMYICKGCGCVSFWIYGCEEYNNEVRSLLSKEVANFKEDGLIDDYCSDCRWSKLGVGLNARVTIYTAREEGEAPNQIVERLKSRLESLGLSFSIRSTERVHCREKRW